MKRRVVRATVNVDAMLGQLQATLQRTMDSVAVGLICVEQVKEPPPLPFVLAEGSPSLPALSIPGVAFQVGLAKGSSFEDGRARFPAWVLGCGLRDCIEAVLLYLDEVRSVAAVFSVGGGAMSSTDWGRTVDPRGPVGQRFHRLGLKDKMTYLADRYDASLRGDYAEEMLSINQARNCLVHRLGVVSPLDASGDPPLLHVAWRRNEFFLRDVATDEERPMPSLPFVTEAETEIFLRPDVRAEKTFALGGQVQFTAQEFSEVVYTCFRYGFDLRTKCLALARAKGVPEAPKERGADD